MGAVKVCGYARISTKNDEQITSFKSQQQILRDYCDKNNLILTHIYSDIGVSGTKLNREGFDKMLEDAGLMIDYTERNRKKVWDGNKNSKPLFDKIITCSTSRFARNIRSAEILDALKEQGIEVYFIDIGLSTFDVKSQFLLRMQQAMDAEYVNGISVSVTRGLKQHAKNYKTRTLPIGYKKVNRDSFIANNEAYRKDENGDIINTVNRDGDYIVIVDKQAQLVEKIFKLRLEGNGAHKIARILDDEGIKPIKNGEVKSNRQNKEIIKFEKATVQYILSNKAYTGTLIRNKYNKQKILNKREFINPEEEWIVKEDIYPQLVTLEDFEQVQKLIAENKTSEGMLKRNPSNKYSRVLKCACGATMNVRYDRNKKVYYSCYDKIKNKNCNSKNISLKELEELLYDEDKLREFNLNTVKGKCRNLINEKIKEIEESINSDKNAVKINKKRKEIEELEEKRRGVMILVRGNMDKNTIKFIQGELEILTNKIDFLDGEIEILNRSTNDKIKLINELKEKKKYISGLNLKIYKENFLENVKSITVGKLKNAKSSKSSREEQDFDTEKDADLGHTDTKMEIEFPDVIDFKEVTIESKWEWEIKELLKEYAIDLESF